MKKQKIFDWQFFAGITLAFIIMLTVAKVAIWLVYDVF